jgi:predicted peroxiredoxin
LIGEAVYLLKDPVVDAIQGVGFPPLRGPFDKIVSHGVPIYV